MKVFQTSYEYTETWCHPSPSEWERLTKVLITTLDESLAQEVRDRYNRNSHNHASVKSFDLTER